MTYTLPVRPDTLPAAILASLERLRARDVVLSLPRGEPSLLADPIALRQLALFRQQTGKEIAIVGGDERLRALAVAAGFVVATSLEDHEQRAAQQQIVRLRPLGDWENAYAEFAVRRAPRPSRPRHDDQPPLDEPPDYVRRLLEELPALPVVYAAPAAMQRSRRTTRKLPAIADDDLVREAYETDEDTVTQTIRTTGQLGQSSPAAHLTQLPRTFSNSWPARTDGR